jgi:polysaccharide biosynthesis transport protein
VIPGTRYSPEQLFAILVRNRWHLIGGLVVGGILAGAIASVLPKSYKSAAVVLVVPQRVPDGYIKPIVAAKIEDRVKTISQEILGQTFLQHLMEEFDLYPELRKAGRTEDAVNRMRVKDIDVRFVKSDAFMVSYSSHDPLIAHKVTERLASDFVTENMKDRGDVADATVGLLEAELKEKQQQLVDSERKLEEYKRLHAGELPTQVGANQQILQNAQMQIQTLTDAMNRERERRIAMQRELTDLLADRGTPVTERIVSPSTGAVIQPGDPLDAQVAVAEANLRELRTRFKDTHPDVAAARRRLSELQSKQAAEQTVIASRSPDAPLPSTVSVTPAARAQQSRIRQLQNDTDTLDRQLAQKQTEEQRLRGVMAELQRRIDASPTRETELVALTRDYQTLQQMYVNLLNRIQDAKLAAKVENGQVGQQFKVIDPARVPAAPFFPDVRLFSAAGAMAGLGLIVLIIGFREYNDATLKTEEDVVSSIGLPVIAVIPIMSNPIVTTPGRMRKLLLPWRGTAALALMASAAARFLTASITFIG